MKAIGKADGDTLNTAKIRYSVRLTDEKKLKVSISEVP
jgi:hypothetical protein